MDIEPEKQRLDDQPQHTDKMDITSDTSQNAPDKGQAPEAVVEKNAPPITGEIAAIPDTAEVRERPREGGDDGARGSSMQMPTIPQPQNPPLTANLIALYGLQPLAASVARFDPLTGEKINKMRKSYEGQLKTLGLSGRNRSVKHEPAKGMSLRDLTLWPEEEWQNQKVTGKDIHQGLPAALKAKLENAMQMQPGPVPNNSEWEDQLGHEKVKPLDTKVSKTAQPSTATNKANGQANGANANAEAIRPKRSGRKRRYDEHSFEGYGEGYVDDDVDLGGYSSGDTQFSRRSSTNKRRKKDSIASPTGFGDRTGSFNSGMVGVATYGR
ncbi:hypothetical protein ACLMJK_004122 [Lecanora helva]